MNNQSSPATWNRFQSILLLLCLLMTLSSGAGPSYAAQEDGGGDFGPRQVDRGAVGGWGAQVLTPVSPAAPGFRMPLLNLIEGGESWQPYPLFGGEMISIAGDPMDPQTIYVGTRDAGVFKTIDGGQTWLPARDGLTFFPIRSLAVDPAHPGTLFAGTDYDGVWKSTDGGVSWSRSSSGLDESLIVFNLIFDPAETNTLYAGLASGVGLAVGNVYKSTDGGGTWQMKDAGIPRASNSDFTNGIFSLAADPAHPGVLVAGTNYDGAYRSADGGETWTAVNGGLPAWDNWPGHYKTVHALAYDPRHPGRLGGIIHGEYYAFENDLWAKVSQGLMDTNSAVGRDFLYYHPTDPNILYSAGNAFKKSTDGGLTWEQYLGWDDSGDISQIAFHPSAPDVIYAASANTIFHDGGMYKTIDGGKTWTEQRQGIMAKEVLSVAVDPHDSSRIYVGEGSSGLFYRSLDGGQTWSRGYTPWTPTEVYYSFGEISDIAVDPLSPSKIYIAGTSLYISTDGGVVFNKVESVNYPGCIEIPAGASGPVYIGSEFPGYGFYKSTDGGATWEQKNQGLPTFGGSLNPIRSMAVDPQDGYTVWAGTQYGGGILKTTDGGEHWVSKGLTETNFVDAIAISPADSRTLLVGGGYSDGRIYKSTDGGETWRVVLKDIAFVQDIVYDPRDPNWVYAATEGFGMLRSSNGGETWFFYNEGLFYPMTYSLALAPSTPPRLLTASYGSGLYWIEPDNSEPLEAPLYIPFVNR